MNFEQTIAELFREFPAEVYEPDEMARMAVSAISMSI